MEELKMKNEDKDRAARWYLDHKAHVDAALKGAIEPIGSDAIAPWLWTAAHWRWFMNSDEIK
jgi:hypothetical protein